jgi:hypothetical protein
MMMIREWFVIDVDLKASDFYGTADRMEVSALLW